MMRYKIQILNDIAEIGLCQFPVEHYEISSAINSPDAILVRSASLHKMDIPPSVKVIGRAGAGVNNIPVESLTEQGIPVLNTPGANANAVKELVLTGMLLACRNIPEALNYVNKLAESPQEPHENVEDVKKRFSGSELRGKTLGVIGLGNVGTKVANMGIALGMHVMGYDPTISVQRAWELSSQVEQAVSIDNILSQSDFISIHVPLIPETRHLINDGGLKTIKSSAVLLNFSRGDIVDEKAVRHAINNHQINAYVCDFPSPPLHGHNKVICLPHLGASTREAEETCAMMIVKQVRAFLENGNIVNAVNLPSVELSFLNPCRLVIVNKNIPNMVAQITTLLGESGFNIIDLVNKSRADIAYTLIDVDSNLTEKVLNSMTAIKGILQVRKILNTSGS